ncbi:type II toxin-antitoxin system Phd/YefM family antitoxin [Longimicrobium sp.]|uniref:type II toxin-antitoxin system Phd/YefM family antitoxin n=1 Tax=Longimicrobium sp. TaxID=2029185 RepID=UPI002E3567DD|nr:type II toxin-antitoxin system Phd/YefM family antitoxin [Longimicrobium sp.]HEX6038748.1 type II toxin-antitoxin system Phd/YefM family antitoxin [Longimicrobium sp.]
MKVYTYTEARQNLATLLDEARDDGAVAIRRRDGSTFLLTPEQKRRSPLDVPGVNIGITVDEIVDVVREAREAR